MTTDSILRSYYNVTSSSFVPFVNPTGAALNLLTAETQGYAIDATTYDTATPARYRGGPVGGTVGTRDTTTPANNLSNVPLDASNLTQAGTSPKAVNWNTFAAPHNLLQRSDDFTVTWDDADGSVSSNTTASPDGLTTADTYTQGATGQIQQTLRITAGQAYTMSWHLKANTATWIRFRQESSIGGNNNLGWFNISTGAVGSVSNEVSGAGAVITATAVGSGWYRVALSGTPAPAGSTDTQMVFGIACVTADGGSTRDTGKLVYVWGAQLNIGSLTSYVPTTGAASGGVRWTPHNYLFNSQDFAGTTWASFGTITTTDNNTTAPDGTLTGASVVCNTSGYSDLHEGVGLVDNLTYTASCYAKAGTTNFVALAFINDAEDVVTQAIFNLVTGNIEEWTTSGIPAGAFWGLEDCGNGWKRISITALSLPDAANANVRILICHAIADQNAVAGESIYLWGAQVNRGPIVLPYLVTTSSARVGIPQGYDVAAGRYGILDEIAGTNLALRSEEFGTTWTTSNASITANAVSAPDGVTTGDKLVEAATTTTHYVQQSGLGTAAGATRNSVSVFAKAGERTGIQVQLLNTALTAAYGAVFQLTGGGTVVSTSASGSETFNDASIMSIGNGWYRCTITGQSAASSTVMRVGLMNAALSSNSYTGDGTSGAFVWGAQAESGFISTSYAPTAAATSTRAVDDMHCTLNSIPYSATTNTFYTDHKRLMPNAGYGGLYPRWIGFGDANDGFGLVSDIDTTFVISTENTVATVELAAPNVFAVDPGINVRIQCSVAMQSNNMAASGNGSAVNIDNADAVGDCNTGGIGTLQFGGPSTRPLIGYIYRVVTVPRRVIDADLPNWRYNYP